MIILEKEYLEKYRKQARNIIVIGCIIGFVLVISILTFALVTRTYPFLIFIPFAIVLVLITVFIIYSIPYSKYKAIYKDYYVKRALESIFTDLEYKPDYGFDESIIRNTEMMFMGDRYESNDYISGKYKNINIEQADVKIEEERERKDSDGNTETYYDTIFQGKWMIFDFNKPFRANMQVKDKRFSNSRISNWGKEEKFKRVKLEDEEFNNCFKIYAQDEEEAFYILTPHFMDKIKKVYNNISGELLFCFIDNKLHIGLNNNKDSFEPSLLSNPSEEQIKNNILSDIRIVTDFVDYLNLDNDLFKKEV